MSSNIPQDIKIYHIIHIDRLRSILEDGFLYSDFKMQSHIPAGSIIGIQKIKQRRLENSLSSFPDLTVGQCVPFYFCPRSVMLYLISRGNHPDLEYRNGQDKIIHLEFDFDDVWQWTIQENLKCAFTTSNAGNSYFMDYSDPEQLNQINWGAVNSRQWSSAREEKQAEFLVEEHLDFKLIKRIGVYNLPICKEVTKILEGSSINISAVEIKPDWYY